VFSLEGCEQGARGLYDGTREWRDKGNVYSRMPPKVSISITHMMTSPARTGLRSDPTSLMPILVSGYPQSIPGSPKPWPKTKLQLARWLGDFQRKRRVLQGKRWLKPGSKSERSSWE
jgi:hypothetical protein